MYLKVDKKINLLNQIGKNSGKTQQPLEMVTIDKKIFKVITAVIPLKT